MTPERLKEIRQKANAAELPNAYIYDLKASLRECAGEIVELEARYHRLMSVDYANCLEAYKIEVSEKNQLRLRCSDQEKRIAELAAGIYVKDGELKRLRTALESILACGYSNEMDSHQRHNMYRIAEKALTKTNEGAG